MPLSDFNVSSQLVWRFLSSVLKIFTDLLYNANKDSALTHFVLSQHELQLTLQRLEIERQKTFGELI